MKIAVLASGGVDSSVALNLLKEEGHDLTAFYLKIWLEDEMSYLGQCPWKEDLAYVRLICQKLGVPLEVVDMQKEYWNNVVSYTIAEAKEGRTPNPDIFCNQLVKFGHFYDKIPLKPLKKVFGLSKISDFASQKSRDASRTSRRGAHETHLGFRYASSPPSKLTYFDKIATGHYANVEEADGQFILKRAPDPIKDQTYFLCHLDQKQLSRAMFPIGKYTKKEVRELAEKFDLPNKDRKDSQGICFLGKIPFKEFLKHHLDKKPGDFINKETGEKVGEHDGFWFYTIGQRQGLGLGGGPWFVVEKDIEKNIIYLAQGYEPEEVYRSEFNIAKLHWIAPKLKTLNLPAGRQGSKLEVKIRHGESIHSCRLEVDGNKGKVELNEKVHGVAPGQYAVFYDGDVCLGCGMII